MISVFTNYKKEAAELVSILGIKPGMMIADIGGGDGEIAYEFSKVVGNDGAIYSVEVDLDRINFFKKIVAEKNIKNIKIIKGTDESVNLPNNNFDFLVLRTSYHHFVNPGPLNYSMYNSLKQGGKLAVIDFTPSFLSWAWMPKGVPKNRGGHGIPKDLLVEELNEVGFKVINRIERWFGSNFCYIFTK